MVEAFIGTPRYRMLGAVACAFLVNATGERGVQAGSGGHSYEQTLGGWGRPRLIGPTPERDALRGRIQQAYQRVEAKGVSAREAPRDCGTPGSGEKTRGKRMLPRWFKPGWLRRFLPEGRREKTTKHTEATAQREERPAGEDRDRYLATQLFRRIERLAGAQTHTAETRIDARIHEWILGRSERIMERLAEETPSQDTLVAAEEAIDQLNVHRGFVEGLRAHEQLHPLQRVFEAEAASLAQQQVNEMLQRTGWRETDVQRLQHLATVHGLPLSEVAARSAQIREAVARTQREENSTIQLAEEVRADCLVALTEMSLRGNLDPHLLAGDFVHFQNRMGVLRFNRGVDAHGVTELVRLLNQPFVQQIEDDRRGARFLIFDRFVHISQTASAHYPVVAIDDAALARIAELSFKHQDAHDWKTVLYEYMATHLEGGLVIFDRELMQARRTIDQHAIADLVDYGIEHGRDPDQRVADFRQIDGQLRDLRGKDDGLTLRSHDIVRMIRQAGPLELKVPEQAILLGQISEIDDEACSGQLLAILSAAAVAKKRSGGKPSHLSLSELAQAARLVRQDNSSLSDWLFLVRPLPMLDQRRSEDDLRN